MTVLPPEELHRLHQLITWEYPPPTSSALEGRACTWCGTATDESAISMSPLDPCRVCLTCYAGQLAWFATWYDWHSHVLGCAHCRHGRTCHVSRGRRTLHELTVEAAHRELICFSCHQPLGDTEPALPVLWMGDSRDYPGYVDAPCLTKEAAAR
ncbi:hypothetical protein [Streptomyces sp. SID10815]|uniref:hypothetical protein n=1 Tax=Streptomyces sp. SID10815 TaxID=2706027 RepID=UPI0013CBD2C3|nr:hypothetical protein [Streptomyces sp. SID10815]NEA51602.1 hypothetical protein [Streptomyces sp. SID10815]